MVKSRGYFVLDISSQFVLLSANIVSGNFGMFYGVFQENR